MDKNTIGSGFGRMSCEDERIQTTAAQHNFAARAVALGRTPGTHSLGKEFETSEESQGFHRVGFLLGTDED